MLPAKRIKELREIKEITQSKLAGILFISQSTCQNMKTESNSPLFPYFLK